MDLKILEFNGIRKWYHNKLLKDENHEIINEQWFRFQIIKICNILSINVQDELEIPFSNELLCKKIKDKLPQFVDKTIQNMDKKILKKYGLDMSQFDNNLPIPSQPFTIETLKNDTDVNKIKWVSWSKNDYKKSSLTENIIDDDLSVDEEEILNDDLMQDLFDNEEEEVEEEFVDSSEEEDTILNEYFKDSDDMEVVGDCLFQTISSILNEANNTSEHTPRQQRLIIYNHLINSSKDKLQTYIGSIDEINLLLYVDDEIEQLEVDDEEKSNIIRTKLLNMIDDNFDQFKEIFRAMILKSNYWGDHMELEYFYNHLKKQLNILPLIIEEESEELHPYLHFLTLNKNTRFTIIIYDGNHYYNKRFQNGNLIFTREDMGFDLFNQFEDEINNGNKIYESYQDYKMRIINELHLTTNFSINFIKTLFTYIKTYKNLSELKFLETLLENEYIKLLLVKLFETQQNTNIKIENVFLTKLNENNQEFITKLNEYINTYSEDSRNELNDLLI